MPRNIQPAVQWAINMENTEIKALELLKENGLYITDCRVSIMKTLIDSQYPMTQDDISSKIGKNKFDKVTIYRTLESFIESGIAHKVFLQDRIWHFELAENCTENQCHPHFTCTSCGKTHCLTEMQMPMAKSPYRGFVIKHQKVQLEGYCPKCNETK